MIQNIVFINNSRTSTYRPQKVLMPFLSFSDNFASGYMYCRQTVDNFEIAHKIFSILVLLLINFLIISFLQDSDAINVLQ